MLDIHQYFGRYNSFVIAWEDSDGTRSEVSTVLYDYSSITGMVKGTITFPRPIPSLDLEATIRTVYQIGQGPMLKPMEDLITSCRIVGTSDDLVYTFTGYRQNPRVHQF